MSARRLDTRKQLQKGEEGRQVKEEEYAGEGETCEAELEETEERREAVVGRGGGGVVGEGGGIYKEGRVGEGEVELEETEERIRNIQKR